MGGRSGRRGQARSPDPATSLLYFDNRKINNAGNGSPSVTLPLRALREMGFIEGSDTGPIMGESVEVAVYDDGRVIIDLPMGDDQ